MDNPSPAAEVIGSLTREHTLDSKAKIDEFMSKVVWFQEIGYFTTSGQMVGSSTQPKLGKYGEPISMVEFYETIGEDQRARTLKKRMTVNTFIGLGALGMGTLGILEITKLHSTYSSDCDASMENYETPAGATDFDAMHGAEEACVKEQNGPHITKAVVFSSAFMVGVTIPLFNRPDKTEPHEARAMADRYNEKLLADLGLTRDDLKSLSHPISATWNPWISPDAVGSTLQVAF